MILDAVALGMLLVLVKMLPGCPSSSLHNPISAQYEI